MFEPLIQVDPVELDLTPERIDDRLAAGWFPWGQRWMTCRAWPMDEGPADTVWVRVALDRRTVPERWRRMLRAGCTVSWHDGPRFDHEHQDLYARFRATRHPTWVEESAALLVTNERSRLLDRTREMAIRDAAGRLIAYRWFLEGRTAIAGMSAIYDTARPGLGSVARFLADDCAFRAGHAWSYPGYVLPGAKEHWFYKIRPGRTSWLDPETGRWRSWDGDEPIPDTLVLAEIRRRLALRGEVVHYPGWAFACIEPHRGGFCEPYYVVASANGPEMILVVWDHATQQYGELPVTVRSPEETPAASP